jgi:hypothetical protein
MKGGNLITSGDILGAPNQVHAEISWVNINCPVPSPYTNDWNEAAYLLGYAWDDDRIFFSETSHTLTSSIMGTHDLDICGWGLARDAEVIFAEQTRFVISDQRDHACNIGSFTIHNEKDEGVRRSGTLPTGRNCIISNAAFFRIRSQ